MLADLEFEYPQKLEKMQIKGDMIKWVEEEENKIKYIAQQKELEEAARKVLTYEEYYDANPRKETQLYNPDDRSIGNTNRDTTYEAFARSRSSNYIFDNELLE